MVMPPKTMSAEELWIEITSTPRPHKLVDFPRLVNGEVIQIAMVILTQEESFKINLEVEKYLRKHFKETYGELPKADELTPNYHTLFELRSTTEMLFSVCKDPTDPTLKKPFFKTKEEIFKHLTTDEAAVLVSEYLIIKSELGPILNSMSDEEVDAWIERLAEGGKSFLAFMTSDTRNDLMISMACRLKKLQTDSASQSSPQTE